MQFHFREQKIDHMQLNLNTINNQILKMISEVQLRSDCTFVMNCGYVIGIDKQKALRRDCICNIEKKRI